MSNQDFERFLALGEKLDRLGTGRVDDLPPREAAEFRRLKAALPEEEPIPHPSQQLSCFI